MTLRNLVFQINSLPDWCWDQVLTDYDGNEIDIKFYGVKDVSILPTKVTYERIQ